jgi:methionyl-tRNA synthetase
MFNKWWPVDHHLIGKDIIRFHNVYWPAMLMSAGIEPPTGYAVGGWLLVGGEKMSKTSGNVVNPLDLVDEFGVDGFRYYVLSDTSYGNDGDFTYEGLVSRYNSDLANNLGNLAARIASVVDKKCAGLGTAPNPDSPLAAFAKDAVAETSACWHLVQPSRALEATWSLIRATNAHLEIHEPWKAEPSDLLNTVMGDALEALRIVTLLAFPAIPDTAREIWRRIGMTTDIEQCRIPADTEWGLYRAGSPVEKGTPLFPRRTIA